MNTFVHLHTDLASATYCTCILICSRVFQFCFCCDNIFLVVSTTIRYIITDKGWSFLLANLSIREFSIQQFDYIYIVYIITTPLRPLFRGGPYQNVSYIFWDPSLNVKLVAERPPGVVFVGRVLKVPSKCKLTFWVRTPSLKRW